MAKTQYKPNYAVEPMVTLGEFAMIRLFGREMTEDFDKQITEKNVLYLQAMFGTPAKFFLNLQKQYNETTKRLATKGEEQR